MTVEANGPLDPWGDRHAIRDVWRHLVEDHLIEPSGFRDDGQVGGAHDEAHARIEGRQGTVVRHRHGHGDSDAEADAQKAQDEAKRSLLPGSRHQGTEARPGAAHDTVPTRRPSRIVRTRSARLAASRSWVTINRVAPSCPAISPSSFSTSWPVWLSRFPVGSSARMSAGRCTSARAIATRCICPPDS